MDELWVEELLFSDRRSSLDELVTLSIPSGRAHPIHKESDETYALTHTVMYLTDLGMRSLPTTTTTTRLDLLARLLESKPIG